MMKSNEESLTNRKEICISVDLVQTDMLCPPLPFFVPIIPCMGNFGNGANFRLPVFGGFTRFVVWRIQKIQNKQVSGCSLVPQYVSMIVC